MSCILCDKNEIVQFNLERHNLVCSIVKLGITMIMRSFLNDYDNAVFPELLLSVSPSVMSSIFS